MNDLVMNINKNYSQIEIKTIKQFRKTTINNILLIENKANKYIVKIYNVDNEKQIYNSTLTQKLVHDLLQASPDVLENRENKLYTRYKNKFYTIQEFIEENNENKIKEIAKELSSVHKILKTLDCRKYKNKIENYSVGEIIENIEKFEKTVNCEKINKEVKKTFFRLIQRKKELLEKYKCEYQPTEFQVIHRDIRANNILIKNNKIFFIDFDYVAYGDLLFEIGSAAMLLSNFNIEQAKEFIKTYNESFKSTYAVDAIFKNLLGYYVQSDFPVKLINKIDNEILMKFTEDRIKSLDFCEKILKC